jgi:hypothetical protein
VEHSSVFALNMRAYFLEAAKLKKPRCQIGCLFYGDRIC